MQRSIDRDEERPCTARSQVKLHLVIARGPLYCRARMREGSEGDECSGEDARLVNLWVNGDSRAAARLISRHSAALSRYFRTHQPADAEDLHQETLLGLLKALRRFRGDSSVRTFLFRIARYTLWSHRRRQSNSRRLLREFAGSGVSGQANGGLLPDWDELERAVQQLPPALAEVLVLALDRGMSREAIADQLGVPSGTIASRMRLAKAQLREILFTAD